MKFTRLLNMLLVLPVLGVSSCDQNNYRFYERYEVNVRNDYFSLRVDGIGYEEEAFSMVEVDPEHSYRMIGNVKAVVVLVDFEDYKAEDLPKGKAGTLEDLNKLVFGRPEDTQWQSLASFYKSSSFDQCHIAGKVIDQVYHTGKTVTQFATYGGATSDDPTGATVTLVKDIQKWLKTDLNWSPSNADSEFKKYDANRDGYVDSLIMIYTCPPHVTNSAGKAINDDLYWAYCHSVGTRKHDIDEPVFDRYFWASYRTFFEGGYYDNSGVHHDWTEEEIGNGTAKLDAHTLIHEYGHVLSLPDYYNGDYGSTDDDAYDPLMELDMMAYNIGDHNAFSKALYGWTSPYIVKGNAKITIRSTTDTGDFILVPVQGKFQDTLLSQYLIVEFLTPTGVAEFDSKQKYAGNYPQWFTQPGVRVCLVDARPGMFSYSGTFLGYTSSTVTPADQNNYYVKFACDNNRIARSGYENCKLIEIIPNDANNNNQLYARNYRNQPAKDAQLFHQGDILGRRGGSFAKGIYVHGTGQTWDQKLGFSLKIEKMTADSCTISFAKA